MGLVQCSTQLPLLILLFTHAFVFIHTHAFAWQLDKHANTHISSRVVLRSILSSSSQFSKFVFVPNSGKIRTVPQDILSIWFQNCFCQIEVKFLVQYSLICGYLNVHGNNLLILKYCTTYSHSRWGTLNT